MTEDKNLKKKTKLIQKNEKKINQGRDYITINKPVVAIQQILVTILFISLALAGFDDEKTGEWWIPLFLVNSILCVASIAMLNGYPLRLYWSWGKKLNDFLEGIEFFSGIGLIAIKIPVIVVIILGYLIYGAGLVLPGVHILICHLSSKRYAKKLDELEKETAKLKEEVANAQ